MLFRKELESYKLIDLQQESKVIAQKYAVV